MQEEMTPPHRLSGHGPTQIQSEVALQTARLTTFS